MAKEVYDSLVFDPNDPRNEELVQKVITFVQGISGSSPVLACALLRSSLEELTLMFKAEVIDLGVLPPGALTKPGRML
jgi:hypothetical protein